MYGKYNSGVASLSPNVAAAEQWAENKGIPPDQLVNFFVSLGNPELAGLIATKVRTEKAAKAEQALAQQPPAAPPTVADKYRMIEQQQAQQAMAAQMAQMQQARMAQAAPGLAGMPNPAMDRASFAGGGIVAFADGGDVQHFANQGLVGFGGLRAAEQESLSGLSQQDELAQINQLEEALRLDDELKSGVGYSGILGKAMKAGAMPMAYAQRIEAERKLAALKSSSAQKAGLPTVAPASTAQAAPASTTQAIPSNVPTLAELQAKYARGQVPVPSSNRTVTADSGRRGSAAPAAASNQDLSNAIDIGEKPAAYASRPIDTTPYLNEQKFIEDQIKTKGLSEKEARSNFWIMAGASLLGSRDPNFATALGAAVKENYGNLIGDLRNIKKENDALALQKIKLDQAIAVAQHTQDEKDRERADTLMNAYQNRVVMRDKAILDSRDKALDRASAERRTTEMYGNRADAAKTTARNNQLRTIITTAESELGRLPGVKYPALMTPEAKARAAELQSTIDRARRELMSGGEDDEEGTGQSVTRTTKSGIPYIMEP